MDPDLILGSTKLNRALNFKEKRFKRRVFWPFFLSFMRSILSSAPLQGAE